MYPGLIQFIKLGAAEASSCVSALLSLLIDRAFFRVISRYFCGSTPSDSCKGSAKCISCCALCGFDVFLQGVGPCFHAFENRQRRPRLPRRHALSRPRCQCAHRGSDGGRGNAGLAGRIRFDPGVPTGPGRDRRVEERLKERISDPTVVLAPLYGAMDMKAQDLALEPAPRGRRRVVLATSIAETSITIEGVRVVIDSGLARVPRFEPDVGVTRLETVRVSRAAADQRRGRAGRTEPGVCYRLWEEPQTQSLPAFAEPEIRSADLAGLLLDCAEWGTADPRSLSWIDPPSATAIEAAREELTELEALDAEGRITAIGRRLRSLPLPPRLARMAISAAELGHAEEAAEIAAVIVERGLGGNDADLAQRLDGFRRDRSRRASDMRKLAAGWARMASAGRSAQEPREGMSIARLLALAFPERIGKARDVPGQFLLANGRGANVDATHPFAIALPGRCRAVRIGSVDAHPARGRSR